MKTHNFDAVSFLAGLAFSVIGLLFLIPETPEQIIDVLVDSGAWFWPVALLAVGLAVIIPVLTTRKDEEPIEGEGSD